MIRDEIAAHEARLREACDEEDMLDHALALERLRRRLVLLEDRAKRVRYIRTYGKHRFLHRPPGPSTAPTSAEIIVTSPGGDTYHPGYPRREVSDEVIVAAARMAADAEDDEVVLLIEGEEIWMVDTEGRLVETTWTDQGLEAP